MGEIKFGNKKIEFNILPSKIKEIVTLRVEPKKKLSVLAPTDLNEGELTKIIKKKASWIIDKFQRLDEIQASQNNKEFISGESLLFKGKLLKLKILPTNATEESVFTDTTTIFCKTSKHKEQQYLKELIEKWYKQKAKNYLTNRTLLLSKKFPKTPKKVRIRNQSLRWGSCTKNKEILINWKIMMAPPSVIDYVIIHELTHLQEKNHTEKFWKTIKNAMPNYEEKKEWLRINGAKLSL